MIRSPELKLGYFSHFIDIFGDLRAPCFPLRLGLLPSWLVIALTKAFSLGPQTSVPRG